MTKKKLLSLILSCSLAFNIVFTLVKTSAMNLDQNYNNDLQYMMNDLNQEIYIPDNNLRKVLNIKYLHQAEDSPITKKQLQGLKGTLFLGNSNISNLTGLEYCKGISGLYLSYNHIEDLTPIKNLKKLTRLNITNQEINKESVYATNGMAKVYNNITDISGKKVIPSRSNNYTYDSNDNTVVFENIYESGNNSYTFNQRINYGSGYTTYFSGNVNFNTIIQ